MDAKSINLQEFLYRSNTQFIIPIYQRNYDWEIIQCKQLLDDILKIGTNDTKDHFVGSIVCVRKEDVPPPVSTELIIIDGQQRLVTVTLIYLALYRLAITREDKELKAEMDKYLSNSSHLEEEKLKLRPTENNDEAIKYLKKNHPGEEFTVNRSSKVIENFNYLENHITKKNFKDVLEGLSKLMIVEVSLYEENDDPQKIFESINSTGSALTQADLIRNYIFMSLSFKDQTKIYNDFWKKIEQLAKDDKKPNESKVSDFFRDYLILINKKIINEGNVYSEFKAKFPITNLYELEKNLLEIKSFAYCYNKLLNPKEEPDKDIRLQLEYINKLGIKVAYPFLMQVYKDYEDKKINGKTFINVLNLTQSFVCRRFIVAVPTNSLNWIFMTLSKEVDGKEVDENDYLMSLQKWLLEGSGSQRFPNDNEVVEKLKFKEIYRIKSKNIF